MGETVGYRWSAAVGGEEIVPGVEGKIIEVTRATVGVASRTTVEVEARLGFDGAAAHREPGFCVQGVVLSHGGIVPGGGLSIGDGSGVVGRGALGEPLRFFASQPLNGIADLVVSYRVLCPEDVQGIVSIR